jgi:hypothetical protein
MVHKMETIGDVWELESSSETVASDTLSNISALALHGDKKMVKFLEKVFKEKWNYIKPKLETEGSVWYVWWMDGVHNFMRMQMKEGVK